MLKKLMSIAVIGMMMVGCGNSTQPTKNVQEQPKQVITQEQEENTPQDVQEPVKDNKEQPKEEVKEQEQPVQQNKQQENKQEQFDDGDADIQFLCPSCGHTLENLGEEGCPWCGFYPGEEQDNSNYNDVYENEPEDNNTNNENLYWCPSCKCFSTSMHDHTYEEGSMDYNEDVQ